MPVKTLVMALSAILSGPAPLPSIAAQPLAASADTGKLPQPPEMTGAKPRIDRDTELTVIVVNAVPGQQDANRLVTPVSVLNATELDAARAATLGQTVSAIPGVQTTAFGAGAGRPVIRGLDGPRVAVLSEGMGSQDVSSVSQDHAVGIEPFLAEQIEILKGPSTLLFGSGAIGGVVNVVDGRIPTAAPANGLSGRTQINHDSVSDGNSQAFRLDLGSDRFVLHADGLNRDNGSYRTPLGTLTNSFVETRAGAVGGSWIGSRGYLGFSVSRYLSDYGNPAEPGNPQDDEPAVSVNLQQSRYDLKAALDSPLPGFDKLEFSFAHTDYQHTEFEGNEVGTRFGNDANEGRLLLNHASSGGWQGALGVQAFSRNFSAVGEESFVPATRSRGVGVFLTGQQQLGSLRIELGARTDLQHSTPQGGDEREFRPFSLSAGMSWAMNDDWHLTLNLDRAQRAPAEEELFAHGPHVASATFEIGNPNLAKETANQAELGLHWHGERVEAKLAAYFNRYADYIYLADTGLFEDDLPVRNWSQADARFRGGEAEATIHLSEGAGGHLDLRLWGDMVRARLNDGGNLPRIPAARFGSQLNWKNENWRASLGIARYFKQDRIAALESDTSGFTLINAHLAWSFFNDERTSWEAFAQGENLGNQTARLSTSLIKDLAPLPGRNVSFGIRGFF